MLKTSCKKHNITKQIQKKILQLSLILTVQYYDVQSAYLNKHYINFDVFIKTTRISFYNQFKNQSH